ncbi:MAG: PAS domain S-box protein [Deltaproteobacteria bacterium]|nr:PAS domain S-box protein [Deltaproteobacteria bacterium]
MSDRFEFGPEDNALFHEEFIPSMEVFIKKFNGISPVQFRIDYKKSGNEAIEPLFHEKCLYCKEQEIKTQIFSWGTLISCSDSIHYCEIPVAVFKNSSFSLVSESFKLNSNLYPPDCLDKKCSEFFMKIPVISPKKLETVCELIFEHIRISTRNIIFEHDTLLGDLTSSKNLPLIMREEFEEFEILKWTRAIFDNPLLGVYLLDINESGKLIFSGANKTADSLLNFSHRNKIGTEFKELFPQMAQSGLEEEYINCALNASSYYCDSIPHETKEGVTSFFTIYAFQISENQVAVLFNDVSEKIEAIEQLRKSEEKFKSYIKNAPLGIFISDVGGKYLEVNQAACDMTGYSMDELLEMSIPDVVPSDAMDGAVRHFEKLVTEGFSTGELKYRKKSGETGYWYVDASRLSEDRYIGYTKDSTERHFYEKQIEEEQNRSKAYLDIAGVIIVVLDINGCISMLNRKGCKILKVEEAEVIGKSWFDFIPEAEKEKVSETFHLLIKGEIEPVEYFENEILCTDGKIVPAAWYNAILTDENGVITGTISSGEDISSRQFYESERRALEEQLNQAVKMESIGRLAGGVAHDFNNMLAPIIGYTQLLRDELPMESPVRDDLDQILLAGGKARDLNNFLHSQKNRTLNLSSMI